MFVVLTFVGYLQLVLDLKMLLPLVLLELGAVIIMRCGFGDIAVAVVISGHDIGIILSPIVVSSGLV